MSAMRAEPLKEVRLNTLETEADRRLSAAPQFQLAPHTPSRTDRGDGGGNVRHRNPFDEVLNGLVEAMQGVDADMAQMAEKVAPFDSRKLSPAEEDLLYDNPSLRYPHEVDPTTGVPLTNAQAAQKHLQEVGPSAYVAWVDDVERRRARRMSHVDGQPTS